MAEASTSSSSVVSAADLRCRVECPVCFELFQNPKSMHCGHSVCQECANQLIEIGQPVLNVMTWVIQCPVCRATNSVPPQGLPTNYSLGDLVAQVVSQESKKLFGCVSCDRKYSANETWICHSCGKNALYCSTCSLKAHRGHTLQELEDLLMNKRKELDLWKEKVSRDQRGLQMRNRDVTSEANRMASRLQSLAHLLHKGSEEWVKNRSREIFKVSRDINKIYAEQKGVDSVKRSTSISLVESQLQSEKDMQNISEKQQKISNEQEAIVGLLSEMDEKVKILDEWRPNFKSIIVETGEFSDGGEDFQVASCSGSPRKCLRLTEEVETETPTPPQATMSPVGTPHYITPPGGISDSDNSQAD